MMSTSSKPLMDLLRNTPPPMVVIQDSMRSIPPPPLCPPPLTILKIVPPPPLPSHLARKCPPPPLQMPVNQMVANSGYAPPMQNVYKGAMEAAYQDFGRAIKGSTSKHLKHMQSNTRDAPERPTGGSHDLSDGVGQSAPRHVSDNAERSATGDAAELVIVLKNLVNLFTMTSQVKATLSRIRPKSDDTGIQHQVSRTRSLVDTFRQQLARRTVMLGRLIPPGTNGKPEIPRELRTKEPAGGDVSPQPQLAPSPTDGATQAAIFSLQALVSGDTEQSSNSASRWGSRVKRRFLAASKPARRHSDKLKGPNSSGPWPSSGVAGCVDPVTSTTKTDSASDEESQRGGYISPGCYIIDGAGLPREPADHVTGTSGHVTGGSGHVTGASGHVAPERTAGAAVAMFGIPLSVLLSEASKKKKKKLSGSDGESMHSSVGEQCRLDRSWRTACDLVPRLLRQAERSTVTRQGADLQTTLASLSQLEIRDASAPAAVSSLRAPAAVSSVSSLRKPCAVEQAASSGGQLRSPREQPEGHGDEQTPSPQTRLTSARDHLHLAGDIPVSQGGKPTSPGDKQTSPGDKQTSLRDTDRECAEQCESAAEETAAAADGSGGWLSATFDEDWFLSTEREEEEQRLRQLKEQEERRNKLNNQEQRQRQLKEQQERHKTHQEQEQ